MKNPIGLTDLNRTLHAPFQKAIIVDTETTGLQPGKDEVLSVAIVDPDGKELFYSLIRPLSRKRWPEATKIHGITWSDVKDKPTILEVGNEIAEILEGASLVVGYNVNYDMEMLEQNGLPPVKVPRYDLMEEYAQAYGRWSDRKEGFLWCKLEQCAKRYQYTFGAHNALEDAKATAHCLKMFRVEAEQELPAAIERERAEKIRRAEHEKKVKEQQEQEEIAAAKQRKKRMIRKATCIAICLISVALLLNSCSIAGGDFMGSLGLMALFSVVFFVSLVCFCI